MGIIKRGRNLWYVHVRIRKNGRIVQRKRTLEGTLEDARHEEAILKQEIREGAEFVSSLKSLETFGDLLNYYEEKKGPFCKSQDYLLKQLKRELGIIDLQVFPDRFEGYLRLYKQTKTIKGTKPLHAANRRIGMVKAAYGVAVASGLFAVNPITAARFPEAKEIPRDVYITADDRKRLLETARNNPRTAHLAEALNYCLQVPIRKGELVNMKIQDVDLFNSCIRVRNGMTKNDQGTYKPIPPDMIEFFRRRVSESKSPDEPVFCRVIKGTSKDREYKNPKIKPLGNFQTAWECVRNACGLSHVRIHDTRHVSATEMVDAGTPEEVVMQVAGWNTNMLRIYYHRNPKKALALVRFAPKCEPAVNPVSAAVQ